MKISIAQINPKVGDIDRNLKKICRAVGYVAETTDLVVFPELSLVGYPPRDLLEKEWFADRVVEGIETICRESLKFPGVGILFGAPLKNTSHSGRRLFNSAVLVCDGKIVFVQHKSLLPTYDVFDEVRYFHTADSVSVCEFKGVKLGISICEDAWTDPEYQTGRLLYDKNPIDELASQGADVFINISASPFHIYKQKKRFDLVRSHALRYAKPFVYVNQIGGNDEIVFDGASIAVDAAGRVLGQGHFFKEHILTVDVSSAGVEAAPEVLELRKSVHDALVLGIRDYFRKCGFSKAVIGLSGGIDSALTCVLVARAIGAGNVLGISMPSVYSSRGSVDDSKHLADILGVDFKVIPIKKVFNSLLDTVKDDFAGLAPGLAEENMQARIRGNILMSFSNKFGSLLVSTGNKSEMAVGYCTLYGDMSGGLSVISDLPKTMVYDVCRYINRRREIVPWATITKPPSAELRPDQLDQDSLPEYPLLDAILSGYIEHDLSRGELVEKGYDEKTVDWVIAAVNRNEYKRRQAAPGLKVTSKAFGVGRRMPIAARFPV